MSPDPAPSSAIRQLSGGPIPRVTTVIAIVLSGGISCGGAEVPTGPIAPVTPVVTSLTITPTSSTMYLGGSVTFTATARDAAGAIVNGQTAIFVVNDTSIATVSGSSVSGKKVGTTTLTASLTSSGRIVQVTAQIAVIPVPVASVVVTPAPDTLFIGRSIQLSASTRDSAGGVLSARPVVWTASDTALASVSTTGLVTAKALGALVVTATAEGKSGSAAVVIRPVPVSTVAISPNGSTLRLGQTLALSAATRDSAGATLTGRAVAWTASDTTIASVTNAGVVMAKTVGAALITASSEGKSAAVTITVTPVPVASVTVTPPSGTLMIGLTAQLAAVTKDSAGNTLTGRTISFTSGDTSVATVTSGGLVTARKAGGTTVTVASEGRSAAYALTVLPVPVATISIALPSATAAIGANVQATVILKDSAGNSLSGRAVTWSSTNPGIATVSATGLILGVSGGSTTITATSESKSATAVMTIIPGPLTIRSGGTYSGSWASDDPKIPAVNIVTTAAVIIENCTIRGKGTLIQAGSANAHVTIRNCRGFGDPETIFGQVRGDFFFGYKIGSATIEHNYMEGVNFGVKLYGAESTPDGPITVRYNQGKNLDGLASDGAGGRITTNLPYGGGDNGNHFFIISNTYNAPSIEVAWNEVVNEPDKSSIGDVINIYKSNGSSTRPITVHDNFIRGGYAPDPTSTAYNAGGITLDGTASDVPSTATAFVKIYANQVVNHANFGIGLATGHDNEAYSNRVVSTGQLSDGRWMATTFGEGIYVWNCSCYNQPATVYFNNRAYDNVVGWRVERADPNAPTQRIAPPVRQDYYLPSCEGGASGPLSKCINNASLPDPVTTATEANEAVLWQQKLSANGIKVGPLP